MNKCESWNTEWSCVSRTGSPPVPTRLLIGHLPPQGGVSGSLLCRDGDGRGFLGRWGSVFDSLGGQSRALGATQIYFIAWDWRHRGWERRSESINSPASKSR